MKKKFGKVILAFCSSIFFLTACQKEEQPPQDDEDIRDLYVGTYVCEVTVKNFQTDSLIHRYIDTVAIAKQGDIHLVINDTKNVQLPEVEFSSGNRVRPVYVALVTIVVFEYNLLNISYGFSWEFYEFKSIEKL